MLKSSAPVQEQEEDPLAYYENHTSQIEVGPEGPGGVMGAGPSVRVGPQWGREGRETINKMGLRWHWC